MMISTTISILANKKTIHTLVDDIYAVVKEGREFSDESIEQLSREIADTIKQKFKPRTGKQRTPQIYPSAVGKPNRQLWYEMNQEKKDFEYTGQQLVNFLYGDIWESILLWLAEQAGHTVEGKQQRISYEGMSGKLDAIIDGVVTDVKTALAFDKFAKRLIFKPYNDPWGYIAQISTYVQALAEEKGIKFEDCMDSGAFLVSDKGGRICVLEVHPLEQMDVKERIKEVRHVVAQPEPPAEYCYPDIEEKNGNKQVHKNCSYCPFLLTCRKDLRGFKYYNGTRYYSEIVKEPTVEEVEVYGSEEKE